MAGSVTLGGDQTTTTTFAGETPVVAPTTTTGGNIIVTVTVPPRGPTTAPEANRAPLAVDDSRVVSRTVAPKVNIDVLTNDSDPDRDPLSIVAFTQPAEAPGSVSLRGNQLHYEPPTAVGATFAYTVSDGQGHTADATVTITLA